MALATVEFANGALGVIEATTAVYPGYLKRIEIHGNEGSAVVEEEDLVKWDFEKKKPRDEAILAAMANRKSGGGGAADPAAIGHQAHAKQFQNVVQAIQQGHGPGGRRARGPPQRRDHPGDLQIGRDRQGRQAAAGRRPAAEGQEEGELTLSPALHCRRRIRIFSIAEPLAGQALKSAPSGLDGKFSRNSRGRLLTDFSSCG